MNVLALSKSVVVVSTHLDDAVLSCGSFLSQCPQATVVTVCAGAPDIFHEGYNSSTTGERFAPDALSVRRAEDSTAMAFLGVQPPIWLDLFDGDYLPRRRRRRDHAQMVREIEGALEDVGAESVIAPLGIFHTDHLAVSNACLELSRAEGRDWYLYMDMPYAQRQPKVRQRREAEVMKMVNLQPLEPVPTNAKLKDAAFTIYETQYVPNGGGVAEFLEEMSVDEQYWRIAP